MTANKIINNVTLSLAIVSLGGLMSMAQTSDTMSNQNQSNMAMKSDGMSSGASSTDRMFVKKAAQGGMAEVELGKLAVEKAQNPEVKEFGQRMVDDHSKANDQLKHVASTENITVPEALNAKDEQTKERLAKLSGAEFDRAYMSDMVTDHTQDVSEFRQESTSGKDASVKNFASQTLPTLEDHLKEARKVSSSVMGSK